MFVLKAEVVSHLLVSPNTAALLHLLARATGYVGTSFAPTRSAGYPGESVPQDALRQTALLMLTPSCCLSLAAPWVSPARWRVYSNKNPQRRRSRSWNAPRPSTGMIRALCDSTTRDPSAPETAGRHPRMGSSVPRKKRNQSDSCLWGSRRKSERMKGETCSRNWTVSAAACKLKTVYDFMIKLIVRC